MFLKIKNLRSTYVKCHSKGFEMFVHFLDTIDTES